MNNILFYVVPRHRRFLSCKYQLIYYYFYEMWSQPPARILFFSSSTSSAQLSLVTVYIIHVYVHIYYILCSIFTKYRVVILTLTRKCQLDCPRDGWKTHCNPNQNFDLIWTTTWILHFKIFEDVEYLLCINIEYWTNTVS